MNNNLGPLWEYQVLKASSEEKRRGRVLRTNGDTIVCALLPDRRAVSVLKEELLLRSDLTLLSFC